MKAKQSEKEADATLEESGKAEPAKAPKAAKSKAKAARKPSAEEALTAEKAALEDRLLRLQADFENYRKRMVREKSEISRRANEELTLELLPAVDHMELALQAGADHGADEAFLEGFRLVMSQLLAALSKHGVEPVDAAGEPFDPNVHEAISHLPSPDVPSEHVMLQVRRGYRIGDMLLRAAQVVVSSGPEAETEPVADESAED